MRTRQFLFLSPYVRRLPDPVTKGMERYVMLMAVGDVPTDLPLDPNPRDQNTNKRVYREVFQSLMEEDGSTPGTFHLKNKGITLIASSVARTRDDESKYIVRMSDGEGIVDGGHTYRLILQGQATGKMPSDQYIKIEILVGVPETLVTDIAGGLNTAVQVQDMSLANLAGEFEWIKDRLEGEPYESVIGYRENEGEKELDIRDVIAYMTLFNTELYPNEGSDYPITAYRAKTTALQQFLQHQDSFKKLKNILPDILKFADVVNSEARDLHNQAGGKAGRLDFMRKGDYTFPFIDQDGEYRLHDGALFPMLGAFRWMVEEDPKGQIRWKGGYGRALKIWRASAAELMKATQSTNQELGYNSNALGKSRNHWATLHSVVIKYDLMSRARG